MHQAIIRKAGPHIEISEDGQHPLPQRVCVALENPLYYTFLRFQHGPAAWDDATGQHTPVVPERRRLFQYDSQGRFVCQRGFLPRLWGMLQSLGYQPTLIDLDPPLDARARPKAYEPNWDRVLSRFEFRPKQDECLVQIASHAGGVIDAVTAFGKMWVIAMVCVLYPHAKIDIVTKRKDVAKSLRALLTRWVPNVGQVGGGKQKKGTRVTVYTADSLHHSEFDADIVLADEIHELMTDRYAELLSRYWLARIYGYTASKETRADNAHHRMEGLLGPTIFQLDYPTAEALGLVVPIIVQWLDIQLPENPVAGYTDMLTRKRIGIWQNETRNRIFASAVDTFYQNGQQVLLLVETVEHALHLKRQLPHFELCYGESALDNERKRNNFVGSGLLDSSLLDMTAERRENLRRAFERREILGAIATGVWAVGVSFNGLEVLGRMDGGTSETNSIQVPGRVCRTDTTIGKGVGIVFDGYDCFDSKARDNSDERRRAYGKQGWTQYRGDGRLWEIRGRSNRVGTSKNS